MIYVNGSDVFGSDVGRASWTANGWRSNGEISVRVRLSMCLEL